MTHAAVFLIAVVTLSVEQIQLGPAPTHSFVLRSSANTTAQSSSSNSSAWLDTSSRTTVADSYLKTFIPSSSVVPGWTGSIANGNAGSTSQAYRDAVLLRVNWFRQMAGLATLVTFSSGYSTEAQQAALMMSANGQLNHSPPSTWTDFTSAGADGAIHSNLCLQVPYFGDPGCVLQYMHDYGSGNSGVGHRRWLLYPQTQNMGTGDVEPPYPSPFANALWVMDSHFSDPRPVTRDTFIAWPSKGYIPYQIVPSRWSFSYPGADFTNATVTMQRSGGPVVVQQEAPQQGYGENSIVWVPDNINTLVNTTWPQPLMDTPIAVTIARVLISGVSTTFTYTVTIIDPNTTLTISGHITKNGTPLSGASISLSNSLKTVSDSTGAYQFGPLSSGTYLVSASLTGYTFTPSSQTISTSSTTADFSGVSCSLTPTPNLTSLLTPSGGSSSFYLTIAAGCPWTATSTASWLTVSPSSGVGPSNVTYTNSANHNLARTANLTVAASTFNFTQASAGQATYGPVNAAVFLNGNWLADSNGSGVFDTGDKFFTFQINGVGDKPVIGDWNGDGRTKAGVYSAGFWGLDYNGNGQFDGTTTDRFYAFGGNPGEIPIVGDWNGDGKMKVGYYIKGFWALDYNGNGQWDGPLVDRFYAFGGNPGEIPVVGDWNGDGRTKIGFYLNGLWQLDYNGNGQFDGVSIDRYTVYTLGPGEKPIVGDWTGSGTTKIGVTKAGFWSLDTNGNGSYDTSDQFIAFGGNPGEIPIVGDWNGDGRVKVGYYINGFWALDYNGNGRWDGLGAGKDRFIALGGNTGEKPVPGNW